MAAKTITIINQKGGTGKTTTAVNLSAALADLGKRILIVDADPQGNATSGVGVNKNELDVSVYDVFLNKATAQETVIEGAYPNLDIIPCNINLTGAEIELVGAISRETRLKKALDPIKGNYDYIFIDSPPSLGLLTLNALVASDALLIPIQCEFYALEGVSQLLNTLNLIRDGLNPKLNIEGVLLTMADFRTNLTTEVINEIRNYFKEKVYRTIIPRNIRLSEAPSHGKPITKYDANSIGAIRYAELAQEFLGGGISHKSLQENELSNSNRIAEAENAASDRRIDAEKVQNNEEATNES